jgi:hypothetical protein
MPERWHPKNCKVCGHPPADGSQVSSRGYCLEHGIARMQANNLQLAEHHGPFFDHWRHRVLAAFGGVPLDDPHTTA